MSRIIITHVGTSILDAHRALKDAEKHDPRGDGELTLRRLDQRFREHDVSTDDAFVARWGAALLGSLAAVDRRTPKLDEALKAAPAELHSLSKLNADTGDRVVLACSDTIEGRFAGRLLLYALNATETNRLVPNKVQTDPTVATLKGVETRNHASAKTFVEEGLPAYTQIVANEYRKVQAGSYSQIVFNVTGGYKGIIPFATMTAQLLNAFARQRLRSAGPTPIATVVYLYEEAAALVELTPDLPIDWESDSEGLEARYAQISHSPLPHAPLDAMIYELVRALRGYS